MSDEKLLNFVEKRKESIEKKRRSYERLFFNNLLGAYSVIEEDGSIYPVSLVDISHDGCLFQVPWSGQKNEKLKNGTEIPLRMYFTKNSYIPVVVEIKYEKEFIDDDGLTYMHYGCEFDKSLPSFQAMQSFIDFLYQFAEHSNIDRGDSRAFFL